MAFDPKRIRRTFLVIGVALLAVVIGVYSYARWKVNQALSQLPAKLGVEVQQSTAGFTFTKSDNGRKQFSISAAKAIQYKKGQTASLKNVRIIVYGRGISGNAQEGVYDQIYGDEFAYDPHSGEVRANGVVHIDLANQGTPSEDPTRLEVDPDSIHLWTSGLVFNQKSGIAETKEKVEFSIPQASGSAVGAHYDSKTMTLDLGSDVNVTTRKPPAGTKKKSDIGVAHIHARSAHVTNAPRRAELADVTVEQGQRSMVASTVQVFLNGNSSIDHVEAAALHARDADPKKGAELMARLADFKFGANNTLTSADLTGPVQFSSQAGGGLSGTAGRADISFAQGNVIRDLRASNNVTFEQKDASGQSSTLHAAAVDFNVKNGKIISAATNGRSEIALSGGTRIQSDRFQADFAANDQISQVRGAPNAIVNFAGQNGQSTSREVIAKFAPTKRGSPLQWVEQNGDFRYTEGQRKASADHARYSPKDQILTANGSPRFEDSASGLSVSADTLRFHRNSNSVDAEANVKATYAQRKAQSDGALLSSDDPIHVTSSRATATTAGHAVFTGDARLWQGASIIEGANIEFDRNAGTVIAFAGPARPVQVNFTQADASGKQLPITMTAGKLVYNDAQRRALFSAPVRAVGQDVSMSARQMEVLLRPRSQSAKADGGVLDQIIASGNVQLEQRNPSRRGAGDKLTYFAGPSKFVLSSAGGQTASIFDAEHGEIQADSLTFFSHDDTVQVGSGEKTRVVTTTRIKEDSKP